MFHLCIFACICLCVCLCHLQMNPGAVLFPTMGPTNRKRRNVYIMKSMLSYFLLSLPLHCVLNEWTWLKRGWMVLLLVLVLITVSKEKLEPNLVNLQLTRTAAVYNITHQLALLSKPEKRISSFLFSLTMLPLVKDWWTQSEAGTKEWSCPSLC